MEKRVRKTTTPSPQRAKPERSPNTQQKSKQAQRQSPNQSLLRSSHRKPSTKLLHPFQSPDQSPNRTRKQSSKPQHRPSPSSQSPKLTQKQSVNSNKHSNLNQSPGKQESVLIQSQAPTEDNNLFKNRCCWCLVGTIIIFIMIIAIVIVARVIPDRFNQECLRRHNSIRKQHRAPPLRYDASLTRAAQIWADSMAESQSLDKDPEKSYGENVCQLSVPSGIDAANYFYQNHEIYSYEIPELSADCCYQFSQMVWIGSRRMGCAFSKSQDLVYVSCKYHPPGNLDGLFRANVLPPSDILEPIPIPRPGHLTLPPMKVKLTNVTQ